MMAQPFILRHWFRTAFAILLCLAGTSAARADLTSENFTYTATAPEVTITGCTGAGGIVVIRTNIENLSITATGDNAFNGCSGLTSLIIPDSVTNVENNAFDGCSGLSNSAS